MPEELILKHLALSLQVVLHGLYVHSYTNPCNNSMKLVLPSASILCDLVHDHSETESGHLSLPAYLLSMWPGLEEEVGLWWKMISPDKGEKA